jgi:site-specific recombinase XerD
MRSLAVAADSNPRDCALIMTLAETGIRNSECRQLLVSDLWLADQITHALKIRPQIAKGGRGRTIPLTSHFREWMHNYILAQRTDATGPLYDAPLFPSSRGFGFLTRRGVCAVVRKYTSLAGDSCTPHAFRHTLATDLLRTTNARVVQMVLGHARLETVMIYTHPTDQDLAAGLTAVAQARARASSSSPTIQAEELGERPSNTKTRPQTRDHRTKSRIIGTRTALGPATTEGGASITS